MAKVNWQEFVLQGSLFTVVRSISAEPAEVPIADADVIVVKSNVAPV